MSGIFGLVEPVGKNIDPAMMERMSAVMACRAKGGVRTWTGLRAGLGRVGLQIPSGPGGAPPPWCEEHDGLVITADARLDGRNRLSRNLGLTGSQAAACLDTQLILLAWKRWGTACADRLLGDFAFAIWDMQSQSLFCARDPMGCKPFYYAHSGASFVFASAAAAVLPSSGEGRALNRARIADLLVIGMDGINKTCSFYEGVLRLPPGHTLVFAQDKLSIKEYWRPNAGPELVLGSDDAYLEAFEEVLGRAVSDRLPVRSPPASMLSGGLDSSTIAGMARRLMKNSGAGPLATYSAVTTEPDCIESRFVRLAIAQGGLSPRTITPGGLDGLMADMNVFLEHMEEPWDACSTLQVMLRLLARNDGHPVLLDGVDGDLVAGLPEAYPFYLARQGQWAHSWNEYREQQRNYYRSEPSVVAYLRRLGSAMAPEGLRRLKRRWGAPGKLARWLGDSPVSRELAREVNMPERMKEYGNNTQIAGRVGLRQACAHRVQVPYLASAIERSERIAAVAGTEHRKPFLDKRLIELCISLPWNQKSRHGWSKFILRRLAEKVMPPELAWRQGWEQLGWKFTRAWLETDSARVLDTLSTHRERMEEWIEQDAYVALIDGLHGQTLSDYQTLMHVYGLAVWLERKHDGLSSHRPGQAPIPRP